MLRYGITESAPVRPKKLRFGLLSAKEIERMSVCEVTETTLYYRGLPASGGFLDPLMGSVDRRHLCASCMRDAKSCQGHPGHMALAFPVYHIGFIETVLKALRTVCYCCTRVCATEEDAHNVCHLQARQRLTSLHSTLRTRKTCPHCSAPRPTYSRTSLGIAIEWPADVEWTCDEERDCCTAPFTARDALSLLRHLSDEDVALLGFHPENSHPMHMILQNMVVPPPCSRPAIYSSEGSRSRGQNDLTVRMMEILKRSHEVRNFLQGQPWQEAPPTPELLERVARLQYEVFMFVNNSARIPRPPGMGRSNGGQNCKSLQVRLKGKEGRVRGNLMGKRVDFSARCVISPDAYFDADRVGIPYKIAKILTVPETVNPTNIKTLSERVRRGAADLQGAQTVLFLDGSVVDIAACKDRAALVLNYGDVVERFLADDDSVVFNRQPSLHMHGMQSHRVRLMPGHTFRMSLVAAAPYNADFDGDEMNVHVCQSKGAQAECAMLMSPAHNCIGAQANKPVMGIVQDSCLGLHLLSKQGELFDQAHACRLLAITRYTKKALPPAAVVWKREGKTEEHFWTGKQLYGLVLPPGLYVENGVEAFGAEEEWVDAALPVTVRAGKLLCGVLRKAHVGTAAGGIIDTIIREFGGVASMRHMGDAQRMTHVYLLQRGHHVNIEDVMLSSEGHERVTERLRKAATLCEDIQRDVQNAPPETAQMAEGAIVRLLSKTLLQTGGIVNEHMSEANSIRLMVTAGSKGSFINLSQICACLGQQSLEGARITSEKGHRTLPCFAPHDVSLESRGMVFNSFALGLTPPELFFHAIGGREGLVDTAVKTSQTGYLQRRLNKAMEEAVVTQDGTVRDSLGNVFSFLWGSDGMHPTQLERVRLSVLTESEGALRRRVGDERVAEEMLRLRANVMRVKVGVLASEFEDRVLLPFHSHRLARKIGRMERVEGVEGETPYTEEVVALARRCPDVVALAVYDIVAHLRKVKDEAARREVVDLLEEKVDGARAMCGESVGCLAAQSVGEPSTQMTLNSVDWTTTMAVRWTATTPPPCPADAEVGAWIDALIDSLPERCQVQPDGRTIYLPLPPGTARALSPDSQGRMVWTNLEAVTRHPPINDDGSNTLVEVSTASGRTVVVTKGKSLLVERDGELVQVGGGDVAVGDRVPVGCSLPADASTLDLRTVFSPTEAIFTDVAIEAVRMAETDRHWFHTGKFAHRCCYARSDALLHASKHREGLLVPHRVTLRHGGAFLPQDVPLDRDFGFFVGAYLAQGYCTESQVHIANNDSEYRQAAGAWCVRNGVQQWHGTAAARRHENKGTSISTMFRSTLIASLLKRTCGHLPQHKRVPGWAMSAPDAFVLGLLDAYLSGDGTVAQARSSASSRSRNLRDGIALLLTRVGVDSSLSMDYRQQHVHSDGTQTPTGGGRRLATTWH